MEGRVSKLLRERLQQGLDPDGIEIEDQSAQHAGHAGARPEGESHFAIRVVSSAFAGMSRLQRQRAILEAVDDLMQTEIHALSIQARTPEEMKA